MKRTGPQGILSMHQALVEAYTIPASMMVEAPTGLNSPFAHVMQKAQDDLALEIEKHIFGSMKWEASAGKTTWADHCAPSPFKKSGVFTDDEELTDDGFAVMAKYADAWLDGSRKLELEAEYPELSGNFTDVRVDPEVAARFSSPTPIVKSMLDVTPSFTILMD